MSDIYRIAVRLTMASNAPAFLSTLAQQVLHVHANVRDLEGGLLRLSRVKLAIGGGLMIAGGVAALETVKKLTEHAKELSHELASVATMRPGMAGVALAGQADSVARATTMRVPGTTEAGNVKLFGEAYSMFGADGAGKVLEPLARFGQVLGSITGNMEQSNEKLYSMIRAGDLSGKIVDEKTRQVDTNKLLGFLDIAAKVAGATHGKVGPDAFFAMAQQGAPALKTMSDDGLMSLAMAGQAMGGFRAGTAAMSMFSQFAGGKMTKPVAEELHKLGLVGDFKTEKGGGVRFNAGSLDTPFIQALLKDPLKGVGMLGDTLTAHGITGDAQTKELFKILGRQTTQRLVSDMLANLPQMAAERGRMAAAEGTDAQARTRNDNDFITVEHNMQAAWENLMQAVAGPQAGVAIDVMKRVTAGLDSLTATVRSMNPATLEALAYGVGALGAAMVGGGVAMLLAAIGPAGWLVLGIGALAGTFKAFAPQQFDQYVGGLKKLGDGLMHLDFGKMGEGIAQEARAIWDALPSKVTGSITGAIDAIAAAFRNAIAGLISGVSGAISTLGGLFKSGGAAPGEPGSRQQTSPGAGGGRYHPTADVIRGSVPSGRTTTAAVHTHIKLDGREIAHVVSSHQVAMHEFPNAIGGHDSYGSWYPSGATAMPS